eukprot:scaffold99422_cov56-Phaeocystis_antarctica.AAC.1
MEPSNADGGGALAALMAYSHRPLRQRQLETPSPRTSCGRGYSRHAFSAVTLAPHSVSSAVRGRNRAVSSAGAVQSGGGEQWCRRCREAQRRAERRRGVQSGAGACMACRAERSSGDQRCIAAHLSGGSAAAPPRPPSAQTPAVPPSPSAAIRARGFARGGGRRDR